MIVEYVRYRIDVARAPRFVEAYRDALDPLLASAYCLRAELARCEEDPASFVVRIEWSSTEDHLTRFRGGAEFRRFFALVRPFVDDIEEMRHYAVLEERSASSAPAGGPDA